MKYKHLIWDWNGTLINDTWLCVEGINHILSSRNMGMISEEKYKEIFSFPVIEYYIKLGFDFNRESFSVIGTEFIDFYNDNFHKLSLHTKVRPVLNAVLKSKRTQSILSAGKQSLLKNWVKSHELSNYFINILGIDNHYADGKIELGRAWMLELNYSRDEVILIGDTIHDSEVAEVIGIDCLLLDQGHVARRRLKKTGRLVFNNIDQLWGYINSI